MNQNIQEMKEKENEQLEVYKNLYEICKEINQNYVAHLGDLVNKANTYLSSLNLLAVFWGLSIFQVTDLFTKSPRDIFEIVLVGSFGFTLLLIMINLFFVAKVLGVSKIESYPDPAEILKEFSNRRPVDYFASMAEHFKKTTQSNKRAIKKKEFFSALSSWLLYGCLLSFSFSAVMTFAWKSTQEAIMSDQDKNNSQHSQGTQTPSPPKIEPVAQVSNPAPPVIVDLKPETLQKAATGENLPQVVQLKPDVLIYSEGDKPKADSKK